MATINSITFNQGSGAVAGSYATGDTITATVDYLPDTPSVVPQTFTLNTTVTDAAGVVTATNTSDFTVNATQPNADSVQVSDNGNRTWAAGQTTVGSGGSLSQSFTATA